MKEEEMSRGKKNWKKLQNIFFSKSLSHKIKDKKFQLFKKEVNESQRALVTSYRLKDFHFFQATPLPLYKDLLHFKSDIDATGKWVWEAEEIAAYFLIQQAKQYIDKLKESLQEKEGLKIIELGAGCSGLAAIAFAKVLEEVENTRVQEVNITDGQEENLEFLQRNLEMNKTKMGKAAHMVWGDSQTVKNLNLQPAFRRTFSFLIICDCLYFTDFHKQLLLTIDSYLKQYGIALLVNPSRGDSMMQFLSLASSQHFQYKFIDFEDELYVSEIKRIQQNMSFNLDKDIPYFIQLQRTISKQEQK